MTKKSVYAVARENGYTIKYGNQHYLYNGAVVRNWKEEPYKGYLIIDNNTGLSVWGSYTDLFDYTYKWDDVLKFVENLKK